MEDVPKEAVFKLIKFIEKIEVICPKCKKPGVNTFGECMCSYGYDEDFISKGALIQSLKDDLINRIMREDKQHETKDNTPEG